MEECVFHPCFAWIVTIMYVCSYTKLNLLSQGKIGFDLSALYTDVYTYYMTVCIHIIIYVHDAYICR